MIPGQDFGTVVEESVNRPVAAVLDRLFRPAEDLAAELPRSDDNKSFHPLSY